MEGTGDYFELVFAAELDEVDGIAGDADGQLRIVFRVFHRVKEHLAVEDVDVEMVSALGEVSVHHANEVFNAFLVGGAEALGDDGEGIGDAVLAVAIAQLGNGAQRGDGAVSVAAVHRVCTGGKGHSLGAAIRRSTGLFAIHHV